MSLGPECRETMRFVFQLTPESALGYMFGDYGSGYLFQCAQHGERLHFTWQCS